MLKHQSNMPNQEKQKQLWPDLKVWLTKHYNNQTSATSWFVFFYWGWRLHIHTELVDKHVEKGSWAYKFIVMIPHNEAENTTQTCLWSHTAIMQSYWSVPLGLHVWILNSLSIAPRQQFLSPSFEGCNLFWHSPTNTFLLPPVLT